MACGRPRPGARRHHSAARQDYAALADPRPACSQPPRPCSTSNWMACWRDSPRATAAGRACCGRGFIATWQAYAQASSPARRSIPAAVADLQLAVAVRAARQREQAQPKPWPRGLARLSKGARPTGDLAARADWADRLLALPLPTPLPDQTELLTPTTPRAPRSSSAGGAPAERCRSRLAKFEEELAFFLELKLKMQN